MNSQNLRIIKIIAICFIISSCYGQINEDISRDYLVQTETCSQVSDCYNCTLSPKCEWSNNNCLKREYEYSDITYRQFFYKAANCTDPQNKCEKIVQDKFDRAISKVPRNLTLINLGWVVSDLNNLFVGKSQFCIQETSFPQLVMNIKLNNDKTTKLLLIETYKTGQIKQTYSHDQIIELLGEDNQQMFIYDGSTTFKLAYLQTVSGYENNIQIQLELISEDTLMNKLDSLVYKANGWIIFLTVLLCIFLGMLAIVLLYLCCTLRESKANKKKHLRQLKILDKYYKKKEHKKVMNKIELELQQLESKNQSMVFMDYNSLEQINTKKPLTDRTSTGEKGTGTGIGIGSGIGTGTGTRTGTQTDTSDDCEVNATNDQEIQ